jgi:hypothetical protein
VTTTTEVQDKVNYNELIDSALASNPLAQIIGEQLRQQANILGEIAEKVNDKSDPNAPKRPTIGEIMKEAKNPEATKEIQALAAKWDKIRQQSKDVYRELLVTLHPEFADLAEDDDSDDSERQMFIAEAKEAYAKIKAGLTFLASQDSVPSSFGNDFLSSIPVVEGARQRTSLGNSDGETLRPRFTVIDVSGPDNKQTSVKTFTDTAKFLAANGQKDIGTSELSEAWVAAGGSRETESGTKIEFSIDEWAFVTVKA